MMFNDLQIHVSSCTCTRSPWKHTPGCRSGTSQDLELGHLSRSQECWEPFVLQDRTWVGVFPPRLCQHLVLRGFKMSDNNLRDMKEYYCFNLHLKNSLWAWVPFDRFIGRWGSPVAVCSNLCTVADLLTSAVNEFPFSFSNICIKCKHSLQPL